MIIYTYIISDIVAESSAICDVCVFALQTIRVTVTSPNASVTNPVLVSVNQLRGVTSWQIPFVDQE